jgi:PAS domain S-box-containing protein
MMLVLSIVVVHFYIHRLMDHNAPTPDMRLLSALHLLSLGLEIGMLFLVYRLYSSHRTILQDKETTAKSERDFRRLADNLPAYIARFDPDLRFVYVNVAYIKAIPSLPSDLLGRSVEDFVGIDPHYTKWVAILKAARQTRQVQHMELEYFRPYQRWLDVQVVPELDPANNLDSLLLIAFDVTEQRRMEYIYRTILDNFPNGVISMINHDLRIVFQKGQGFQEFGYDSAQFVGKPTSEIIPTENAAFVEEHVRAALAGERRYLESQFSTCWYSKWIVPVMDDQGRVVSALAFTQNITQRKQAEQQRLEIDLEREKRRLLDEFLRDVSHDLRTPLTTVVGSGYVIAELVNRLSPQALPPAALIMRLAERAAAVRSSVVRLQALLDSMLEMLRLDQLPEYQFAPTDLTQLIANVIAEIQPKAAAKAIELAFTPPEALPPLSLDGMEFARVVQNLVDNAIRYTPNGGRVAVTVAQQPQGVVMSVSDTGIGIPAADLPHIFDRFYRADKMRNSASGGSGLGLAIVQKIVKAHGGQVEVQSVEGEGSTFYVVLPAEEIQRKDERKEDS